MTRKITKSNQSEQRSDRGAKRSGRGGAYSGAPALHPYAFFGHVESCMVYELSGIPSEELSRSASCKQVRVTKTPLHPTFI